MERFSIIKILVIINERDDFKMPNPNRTNLEFDKYIDVLVSVINESKFMKRAEMKPMSTPKGDDETHLTSRAMHMRQAADIAKKLAKGLELNENLAYGGMLMHDAGHPFNAHEGEQILRIIGALFKCGFFHHSAKGPDVVFGEDIIGKVIARIPETQRNEQLENKLRDEFYYFLDIIVSHDGESTSKDIKKMEKVKYHNIKEAVLSKISSANCEDKYKCLSETAEGQLAKPADVIAYLKSDMLDAFELNIVNKLNDDYLEQIGTILYESDFHTLSNKEKIDMTKKEINRIKKDKIRELRSDIIDEDSKKTINIVDGIINELESKGMDTFCLDKEQEKNIFEIVTNSIEEFKNTKRKSGVTDENHINAEAHKIVDCIQKQLKIRQSVIEELMTRVQDKLCNDYIQNSKGKSMDQMGFSKRMEDAFYAMKKLNYTEFVQYTKRKYQTTTLPKSVFKITEECAQALIKTGLIRDKFYDSSIRNMIKDKEILNKMVVNRTNEADYDKYKEKLGINELKPIKRPRLKKKINRYKLKLMPKTAYKKRILKGVYGFAQRQGNRFANSCEDAYNAVPTAVRKNIEKAIHPKYQQNDYLPNEEKKVVDEERKRILEVFGGIDGKELNKKNFEEYIQGRVEEERKNLEEKVAYDIAIKYIGGTTDRSILEFLTKTGIMTKKDLKNGQKRGIEPNKTVQRLAKQLEEAQKEER